MGAVPCVGSHPRSCGGQGDSSSRRLEPAIGVQGHRSGIDDFVCRVSSDRMACRFSAHHGSCRPGCRRRVQRHLLRHEPSLDTGDHLSHRRELLQAADAGRQSLPLRLVVSQPVRCAGGRCQARPSICSSTASTTPPRSGSTASASPTRRRSGAHTALTSSISRRHVHTPAQRTSSPSRSSLPTEKSLAHELGGLESHAARQRTWACGERFASSLADRSRCDIPPCFTHFDDDTLQTALLTVTADLRNRSAARHTGPGGCRRRRPSPRRSRLASRPAQTVTVTFVPSNFRNSS